VRGEDNIYSITISTIKNPVAVPISDELPKHTCKAASTISTCTATDKSTSTDDLKLYADNESKLGVDKCYSSSETSMNRHDNPPSPNNSDYRSISVQSVVTARDTGSSMQQPSIEEEDTGVRNASVATTQPIRASQQEVVEQDAIVNTNADPLQFPLYVSFLKLIENT